MLRPESPSRRHVRHRPESHDTLPYAHRRNSIVAIGVIALLASWAGAATLYILFRDDALKIIVERQIATTRSYEAQVDQLESEIERLRSLKLIDQERVDRALADLARRQSVIETRQSAIRALGTVKPDPRNVEPEITGAVPPDQAAPKPSPLSGTIMVTPPAERWSRLESRPLPPLATRGSIDGTNSAIGVRIVNLGGELAQLEAQQSRSLNAIEEHYDARESRLRKVFADLNMKSARTAPAAVQAGMGGPFLPWTRTSDDPFTRQLHRIRMSARTVETLERDIVSVPVRRPTAGEADVTSTFGMRLDPFIRQLAMHTGVDFRGEPGDPVRATASGKVVQAERNGGYGLMVEIDHGNGYATRYAHLSGINVAAGANVAPGAIVGRIGSTGRSTGPHLHYEVRLNGEPIDPQKFLRAALRLEH